LATATLSTQSVTTAAATYKLSFSGAGTVTTTGTNIGVYSAGSNSLVCTAGTLTLTVVGSVTSADLRVSNDGVGLPAYQAVVTSTNYDTTGFPLYLKFDGVDDGITSAATINFTATAQMSAFVGARKTKTVAYGLLYELSASSVANSGSFSIFAPDSTSNRYGFVLYGTSIIYYDPSGYAVPISNVLSCVYDISGATLPFELFPRINGVNAQVGGGGTSAGTGNFGNYSFYVGLRAGLGLAFEGRLYFPLVDLGRAATATEVTNMESYINTRNGIY
jgi:hypothetical protein